MVSKLFVSGLGFLLATAPLAAAVQIVNGYDAPCSGGGNETFSFSNPTDNVCIDVTEYAGTVSIVTAGFNAGEDLAFYADSKCVHLLGSEITERCNNVPEEGETIGGIMARTSP
jgi:hypothetical protein